MGRTDLSFNLGTCLSTLKTVLPPAAPQGVTPSSRWLPIAQSPGRGLLMEKAGFYRRQRAWADRGYPGTQRPVHVPCLGVLRVTASGNKGVSPETAAIRGGSFGAARLKGTRQVGQAVGEATSPRGPATPAEGGRAGGVQGPQPSRSKGCGRRGHKEGRG